MSTALVARLDSAGDVLITGPAVRAVASAHDRVVFLCGPRGRAAAELLPGIDEIIEWQAPWVDFDSPGLTADHVDALVKQLRDHRLDRVFILTSFHQSPLPLALICRMASVPWIAAISEDYPGTLLDVRHHVADGVPEPLRALFLVQAGGIPAPPNDDAGLRIRPVGELPEHLRALVGSDPFVAFHPCAAVPARMPSVARSTEMVAALSAAGHRVVITGSEAEYAVAEQVCGGLAVNLAGRTSMSELAAVYAAARVVVVPNTGPAHLAAAVGAPVVSLFAPVVPASQWKPMGLPVVVLGDQDAPCRNSRARRCPIPNHPCLDGITDTELLEAIDQLGGRP
ncbi:glycosyltransferase family 9 protein [Mycobacterium sp. NPDC003323]